MKKIIRLIDTGHDGTVNQMTDNEIASCLPQLVQALKYDVYDMSELGVFLIERAIVQPALIGIPFFWCCKVEFRSAHCRGRYLDNY